MLTLETVNVLLFVLQGKGRASRSSRLTSFILCLTCGNLVYDPELKTVSDEKKVCVITVASNRPGKDGADVLRVEVWGKVAETCKKYLKKGSGVVASGDLEIELYEKDGETRVAVRLVNAQVEFTDRAPAKEQSAK